MADEIGDRHHNSMHPQNGNAQMSVGCSLIEVVLRTKVLFQKCIEDV